MTHPIQQHVDVAANAHQVYTALLDSRQFAIITGAPADIKPTEGGTFSCFGGFIYGRTVELLQDKLIVQAWRVKIWPEGLYSIVTFRLEQKGSGTRLTLTHEGFPAEMRAHLNGEMPEGGWRRQYLDPLKKHLG